MADFSWLSNATAWIFGITSPEGVVSFLRYGATALPITDAYGSTPQSPSPSLQGHVGYGLSVFNLSPQQIYFQILNTGGQAAGATQHNTTQHNTI